MLAVVQNDQHSTLPNIVENGTEGVSWIAAEPQCGRKRNGDQRWVVNNRQIDKADTVRVITFKGASNSDGDSRLADSTGTDQCHVVLVAKISQDVRDVGFASYYVALRREAGHLLRSL